MSDNSDSPIKRVTSRLKGVKRSGAGYVACCPAHDDRTQSLGVDYVDGRVLLRCHTGCSSEAIVSALGLGMKDLFAAPKAELPAPVSRQVTLAEIAALKKLPPEFLQSLGWSDARTRHGACVNIAYPRRDGTQARCRVRSALVAKEGTSWGAGTDQIAYDPDAGQKAARDGYLVIVEGETDTATLLFADVPALGIPGSNMTHTLEPHHVAGLKALFVVKEPTTKEGAKGEAAKKAAETFVSSITERAQSYGYAGPVHVLVMPDGAKDPSALFVRDPAKFEEIFHHTLSEAAKPPAKPLDNVWRTLEEWGSLKSAPPSRRWLLDRADDETNGERRVGVLPMSKVGMLVAAGGVGKTMALISLALAVATGRKWLDFFGIANEGPVLLALGEEDEEECWRRFYQAAHAMRLTDAQIEKASKNIVVLPLAGTVVNLIKNADGETVETAMMQALRTRLEDGTQWRLIILDPLSRFAGFDSEKDNSAATTFISVVESLLRVPGRPAILIAHHTNKASRQEGAQAGNAANARGASALIDGVRWAAELAPKPDGTVEFKVTKTNYSMGFDPITLTRDTDYGGFLRIQTAAEAQNVVTRKTERHAKAVQSMRDLVVKTVSERPGIRSGNDLFALIGGNRPALFAALRDLKQDGVIEPSPNGFRLTERSGLRDQ